MVEQKTEFKTEMKEFVIPLRKDYRKVPDYQKANRAVKMIKKFLVKHMKVYDRDLKKIKLDKFLNEYIWARGIKNPKTKVKVKAWKEGEIIKVELSEIPQSLMFKKIKLERREQKVKEILDKKEIKKQEEKSTESLKPEEIEKKEEEMEKKASVIESEKGMEKKIARIQKHETKISKKPKRPFRKALQK
ncbi:MAG: 50S ribosomal protein L31e [Candidatus Pacearchaeota archaeon]